VRIKQAELDVFKKFGGASNPELIRKQAEIDSLFEQIKDVERGKDNAYIEANGFIPLYKVPEKSLEFARLQREVKVKQNVFTYLQTEYESSRITENKEAISFVRLDEATPPKKPVRPIRSLIVGLAGIVSCLAMFMLASFLEYIERRRREETGEGPPAS
jgi:capsule polysaccharide export protein KpsE/RkpR